MRRYNRPRDKYSTKVDEGGRECTKCLQYKPWSDFSAEPRSKSGHKSACKACSSKIYNRNARERALMANYGMSLDDYDVLLDAQGGECAICPAKPTNRALAVDHCHKTGRVRALLCGACNVGLGSFEDNPERLRKAAEYLEVHND